ncbi:HAMP domain-containing protein [Rhodoferax sp.]|uniref:HAMP domain-containing protein n=1 Tax=Rhodoferax sp. TaxID=50421 RepID=UPI0025F2DA92|nr:HAMP domain-containing protein [Rhodoferax sp.]
MPLDKKSLVTWFTRGTYPRLYLPLALLIVLVVAVRYYFLVSVEVGEARQRATTEVQRMGHFLVPALRTMGAEPLPIQQLLENELRYAPTFERLEWLEGQRTLASAHRVARMPAAPQWFVQWLALEPVDQRLEVTLPQGQQAVFRAVVDSGSTVDEVWNIVRAQLVLTGINVLIIFVALTLLLRANARLLGRLSSATRSFQSGQLATRMTVSGTLETQAVATTFNAMAAQIEQLVTSLQQSEAEQADQLHFTRQLIDSLPLPVFVRSARDICLVVNPAWEQMFGIRASLAVGTLMPSFFDALEEDIIDITDPDDNGHLSTTSQEVYSIQTPSGVRYVLYFKAPFTNRHGVNLGTIATLVDVTERERSSHTLM